MDTREWTEMENEMDLTCWDGESKIFQILASIRANSWLSRPAEVQGRFSADLVRQRSDSEGDRDHPMKAKANKLKRTLGSVRFGRCVLDLVQVSPSDISDEIA